MTERTITARVVLNVTVIARDTDQPDDELVALALESMWIDDSISLNEDDCRNRNHLNASNDRSKPGDESCRASLYRNTNKVLETEPETQQIAP